MAVAQHTPGSKPTKALPARHFELPDELRGSLHRASDLIRKRRMELREDPLPTSLAGLDRLLGGGLPRGELVELVGRGSCGRFAALLATLRAVTGRRLPGRHRAAGPHRLSTGRPRSRPATGSGPRAVGRLATGGS